MFIRTKLDTVLAVVFFVPLGVLLALGMLHIPMLVAWDGGQWREVIDTLAQWWLFPLLLAFVFWNICQWIELLVFWDQVCLASARLILAIAGSIAMVSLAILLGIGV